MIEFSTMAELSRLSTAAIGFMVPPLAIAFVLALIMFLRQPKKQS
ncbi:MAG: hypothetical protein NZM38_00075 [Cytophagales bacterium]|nr:hypothetical protein [Cytophagales bacterium]MDW8383145.1 hypothetical protein [Flammeovirgaceae bacterium]